jgi:hypothetical protein
MQLRVPARIPGYRVAPGILDIPISGISLKRFTVLIVVCLSVAACGDAGLLDGLGDRSVNYVHGGTTTTTTTTEGPRPETPQGSIHATDVDWYNDTIAGDTPGMQASQVISIVWSRGDGVTSVIQASRSEIAAALPGVQFPELVPDTVGWVTSQLVFDVASGLLSEDTSAQFGLWHNAPYTTEAGRTAVMQVRPATSADIVGSISPEETSTGLNLSWAAEAYHYVIECPSALPEENCWQMAESVMPLSQMLPDQG